MDAGIPTDRASSATERNPTPFRMYFGPGTFTVFIFGTLIGFGFLVRGDRSIRSASPPAWQSRVLVRYFDRPTYLASAARVKNPTPSRVYRGGFGAFTTFSFNRFSFGTFTGFGFGTFTGFGFGTFTGFGGLTFIRSASPSASASRAAVRVGFSPTYLANWLIEPNDRPSRVYLAGLGGGGGGGLTG